MNKETLQIIHQRATVDERLFTERIDSDIITDLFPLVINLVIGNPNKRMEEIDDIDNILKTDK